MRKIVVVSGNRFWVRTRTWDQALHARVVVLELQGKSLTEIEQYCTKILEDYMSKAAEERVE